jgi:hypothetical protein
MPNGECETDAEAGRIAAELVRLQKAGAIKNEQDASSYANLIRLFGARFTCPRRGVSAKAWNAKPGTGLRLNASGNRRIVEPQPIKKTLYRVTAQRHA